MALDVTIKGTDSDSYNTLAEANTYFENHKVKFDATWDGLSDANKEAYLREGASALDMFSGWKGFKANENQRLEFPRTLAYLGYYKANQFPSDEVHRRIKDSQLEMAMILVIRWDTDSVIENRYEEELEALSSTVKIKYAKRHDHVSLEGIAGASVRRVRMLMRPWDAQTRLRRN